MSNNSFANTTFIVSLVAMLLLGGAMQAAHMQIGLIASELACILGPALLAWHLARRLPDVPTFPRLRRLGLGPAGLLWLLFTAVALAIAANAVTGLLALTITPLGELAAAYEQMFHELMYPPAALDRALAIVAVVVMAPLCEEALFRGVLLPLQRSAARSVAAVVLVNGALFALLHVNPLSFLALWVIGAFFAHVVLLTGSLWPAILGHAALNLMNGVVAPELMRTTGFGAEPSLVAYLVASLVLMPVVAESWRRGARRLAQVSHDRA